VKSVEAPALYQRAITTFDAKDVVRTLTVPLQLLFYFILEKMVSALLYSSTPASRWLIHPLGTLNECEI
jgi:hypothetical protein